MLTYNPSVDIDSTPIEQVAEMPLNEEIARAALNHDERANLKSVPAGLLRLEKKIDESQMADFSTPIEEVMAGPNQMIQNEVMGTPQMMMGGPSASRKQGKAESQSSKNPLGLTDEQFQAALAGVAGVLAFSKPVQSKLRNMIPKFVNDSGDTSLTGLIATALVVAIIFYFAKKFIMEKS
jgi:hypothetical protein